MLAFQGVFLFRGICCEATGHEMQRSGIEGALTKSNFLFFRFLMSKYHELNMSDQGVLDELNLERSTYYRRKKEAILLCGILLWDEVWDKRFA